MPKSTNPPPRQGSAAPPGPDPKAAREREMKPSRTRRREASRTIPTIPPILTKRSKEAAGLCVDRNPKRRQPNESRPSIWGDVVRRGSTVRP